MIHDQSHIEVASYHKRHYGMIVKCLQDGLWYCGEFKYTYIHADHLSRETLNKENFSNTGRQ